MRDTVKIEVRGAGSKKVLREQVVGDDLEHKTGRWMHKGRDIDREHDLYRERVIDPETGEMLRDSEKPLSQHRGHGSARNNRAPSQNPRPKAPTTPPA